MNRIDFSFNILYTCCCVNSSLLRGSAKEREERSEHERKFVYECSSRYQINQVHVRRMRNMRSRCSVSYG